jgi:deferrochelatase/peroxidase EfeB
MPDTPTPASGGECPFHVSRRKFLTGAAAGVAGTAIAGGVLIGGARVDAEDAGTHQTEKSSYPFHGIHQAGILTPGPSGKQAAACYASFNLTTANKAEVVELMQTLTSRARFLAYGGTPPDLGIAEPPSDSDVLGPDIPADGLTVTTSVGASFFDDRFGLAAQKPKRLTPMRIFPNDSPEPQWMHGDLLLQLCANHPDTIHHTIRDIAKHTRGAMQLNWKIEGYGSPARPSGTSRNLLGFKDGTANPTGSLATDLVWVTGDEPAWALHGSYQVVRIIRMLVEFWDRVSINEQEGMFGRRRDSGAPLDGTTEFQDPDYAADPDGKVIPLDAHIRLANPRTAATANQRLIRRSYNYDLGLDQNGNIEAGHIFTAYQQDVKRQFETIQERLIGEPLIDYVQPFGGGYFYVFPGVRDHNDWYGRTLLT